MAKHAIFSPSGFKALMLCPAKPAMERGLPDESSEFADEGTAAHFLGAESLRGVMTIEVGDVVTVQPDGECNWIEGMPSQREPDWRYFEVDEDFRAHVQTYVDTVRDYQGDDGELFVEEALPIDHITGEEGAEGTGDAIILRGDELIVGDLKFGRGVEVQAEGNVQLKLYALGALRKFDLVGDIQRVRGFICQPRAGGTTEAVWTVQELHAWARDVATPAAAEARRIYALPQWPTSGGDHMANHCKPHEDACRFCKAKPCKAMDAAVQDAMALEFTDLTTADQVEGEQRIEAAVETSDTLGQLGTAMDAVPLVELWCKAIRARVEKHLLAGKPVEGYKLVAGRKGARAWSDAAAAEKLLKGMRLKKEQMYDFSLISPTSAEKLLKPTPKRWAKAQALITQNDGKPSVAPISDKHPPLEIQPVASEFTPITETSPATADDLV